MFFGHVMPDRWRRIGVRQVKPEDGSWNVVTPSEVRCVGGADAEAMPVGIGGDEGVAEGELGGFQGHGEAELTPGAVNAVDIVAGVTHCSALFETLLIIRCLFAAVETLHFFKIFQQRKHSLCSEHGRFHRGMNAFDARHIEETRRIAD